MKKVILYTSLILNLLLIICVFILIGSSSILSKNGLSSIQGKTDSLGVEEKRLFDEVLYDVVDEDEELEFVSFDEDDIEYLS